MTDPVTNHTSPTKADLEPETEDSHICQLCKKRDEDNAETKAAIEKVMIALTCFLVVGLLAELLLLWFVGFFNSKF